MDKIVQSNIKRFLGNVKLMYDLVRGYYEDGKDVEKVIGLLKSQHSLNKSLLADLGHVDDDAKRISHLNQQIRDLESKLGNDSSLDFETIARFIEAKNQNLSSVLEGAGLFPSVNLHASAHVVVEIMLFSLTEKFQDSSLLNFKSEAEHDEYALKHEQQVARFKENFDHVPVKGRSDDARHYFAYTDSNIRKLTDLCEEFFDATVERPSFELRSDEGKLYVNKFSFFITCTEQGKNFQSFIRE